MAEYHPRAEKLQLTEHDVLGNSSSRYTLEEISLDGPDGAAPINLNFGNGNYSDPLNVKPSTRTDKVLLLLFGITTEDLHGLGKILLACGLISVIVLIGLILHIFFGPPQIEPHGAVATDVKECSEIGVHILKKGGSAVDAAISSLFCLQVINPQSAGIGGGGFILIYDHKTKASRYIDFRESAPSAFKSSMMDDLEANPVLSIGIPGELRGLHMAHTIYGKLPWSDLVLPAAALARTGFEVSKPLEQDLWRFARIESAPSSLRLKQFLYPNGKPLKAGQIIKRPEFAEALERIAYNGVEEFYSGLLAQEIIGKFGGKVTKEDLANYTALEREPLSTTFREYNILTAPPPSSGASFLLALNILEGFNFTQTDVTSVSFWHTFIESLKFSFTNKNRLGDPDFEPGVNAVAKRIIQKTYADQLRMKIENNSVLSDYGVNVSQPLSHGTTHVSAADTNELFVSVTSSINQYFGSGLMTPSGIILNDQLNDFAPDSMASFEQANLAKPRKRPLSSMSPVITYHPQRACVSRIAIGGSNSTHIPAGILNSLLNIIVFGMNLTDAIEYPRVYADLPGNPVFAESQLNPEIISVLRTYGHNITTVKDGLSVVQAVMKRNKTITAHSDSRKYGEAAIY